MRARFGGRNGKGRRVEHEVVRTNRPRRGCDDGDEPAESTVTARARSAAEAKARTSCAGRDSSSS